MLKFDFIAIRIFHVVPTLSLFATAIFFSGVALKRRKEEGLGFIFIGLILLFLAMLSLQVAYWLAEQMIVEGEGMIIPLTQAASWLPLLAGACLAVGWCKFSRKKEPNQAPEPTSGIGPFFL